MSVVLSALFYAVLGAPFAMGAIGFDLVDHDAGRYWRIFGNWVGQRFRGKVVHDSVLDGAFSVLDDANIMTACSAEPANRTEAVTTYALADVVPTYTGPADGDTSGRKLTVDQKAGVTVDTTGTATHVALSDATNRLYVTTCTSQALTSGNTVTFPAWDVEILDPT